ncbi:MAG: YfaP family protein [Armatimonadota bacterium]
MRLIVVRLIYAIGVSVLITGCSVDSPSSTDRTPSGSLFSADLSERLKQHGAQTGDVQASLIWNNYNDLDLHIIDPNDERIYFAHKRARSGGHLDVDMNAGGRESNEPVENIYFPEGRAPAGRYRVYVHYYAQHDTENLTPFRCEVLVKDKVHKFAGDMSRGEQIRLIYEFTLEGRQQGRRPRPGNSPRLFSPMRRGG